VLCGFFFWGKEQGKTEVTQPAVQGASVSAWGQASPLPLGKGGRLGLGAQEKLRQGKRRVSLIILRLVLVVKRVGAEIWALAHTLEEVDLVGWEGNEG
jgi:hypothetical protein